jgi:hypothetical protein
VRRLRKHSDPDAWREWVARNSAASGARLKPLPAAANRTCRSVNRERGVTNGPCLKGLCASFLSPGSYHNIATTSPHHFTEQTQHRKLAGPGIQPRCILNPSEPAGIQCK